jgi:DNA-binding LytR/AlgR family response regulator
MQVLIIEDEAAAARHLTKLIKSVRPNAQIVATLQSVQQSVAWLDAQPAPDLVFMDIQLADGISFSVFTKTKVTAPIVFTTAFDQYALRAFKVNSIDYLLKPIDSNELEQAIGKYEQLRAPALALSAEIATTLLTSIQRPQFRSRFLVKAGKALEYLNTDDICYAYSEDGLTFLKDYTGKRYLVDQTLEQIESSVDPQAFFRINRKVLIHIRSVRSIHPYLNSRLLLKCDPAPEFELVVARDRASDFKKWIDA